MICKVIIGNSYNYDQPVAPWNQRIQSFSTADFEKSYQSVYVAGNEHGTFTNNEYTIFHEHQAYAEYLIEYVQDPTGWFYQITNNPAINRARWYPFSPR